MASTLEIIPIRAFDDNYIWCIHDGCHAVVVDPGDARPVIKSLEEHGLRLEAVLITHHHADHTGGIKILKDTFNHLPIIGPNNPKIKGLTQMIGEGEEVSFNNIKLTLSVLDVPGHTLDHIAFYNTDMLFCGDTLFCAGCGRLFEGTPAQMHNSLAKLMALHDDTPVYCTHEYTAANLKFAEIVEPKNQAIKAMIETVKELRLADLPSLPSNIGLEKSINPFVRTDKQDNWAFISEQTKQPIVDAQTALAAVRGWKDRF